MYTKLYSIHSLEKTHLDSAYGRWSDNTNTLIRSNLIKCSRLRFRDTFCDDSVGRMLTNERKTKNIREFHYNYEAFCHCHTIINRYMYRRRMRPDATDQTACIYSPDGLDLF